MEQRDLGIHPDDFISFLATNSPAALQAVRAGQISAADAVQQVRVQMIRAALMASDNQRLNMRVGATPIAGGLPYNPQSNPSPAMYQQEQLLQRGLLNTGGPIRGIR